MHKFRLLTKKMLFSVLLMSIHAANAWIVKVANLTDQQITVDIRSSQSYLGSKANKKECSFFGQQIDPNSSRDFDYKDVNPICVAPCTKSVTITNPIRLKAKNSLTSCSNVIVTVSQDENGKWKIEYHDWTHEVLKFVAERTTMPVNVQKMCDKFSGSPIQYIAVFRQPIQAGINELITILTKNELRQLNYDELYHTGFIIECQNTLVKLERNETVSNKIINYKEIQNLEQKVILLPRTIAYDEFINNAMEGDPNFWKYNPITNNCQLFVLQCLKKNDIPVSESLHQFIYQDAGKVLAKSPKLKTFAVGSTSLANRIDNIIEKTAPLWQELPSFPMRGIQQAP